MSRFQVLIAVFSILGSFAFAGSLDVFKGNGEYKLVGRLSQQGKELFVNVFERSANQEKIRLLLPHESKTHDDLLLQATMLRDRKVELIGQLTDVNGRKTLRATSIVLAAPDPLDPSDGDGFWRLR